MFKVLLFSWVVITVVLLVLLLWYLITWFTSILAKQNTTNHIVNMPISNDGELEEVVQTEAAIDQEVMPQYSNQSDDTIYPEYIQETVIIIEETPNAQENSTIIVTQDAGEGERNEAEEKDIPSQDLPADSDENFQVSNISSKKNISSTQYTATNITIPEMPKDYDATRNIAQGHSRDDIIRDKFDKHLQKIRYEAGILKQRNDMLGYEKKLVEGLTLLPTDKDFQKQLADLYFHQGKYKKSLSLLKKILLETPDDHYALWQVGEIALNEGHVEDAFVHFQQAYAYCEDNPKYCFSLAQRYYDAGDLEQALPLMEKMVKLRPKSIEYLVSLSHVQHKMGLRDAAKQSLLRALELDPMNITIKQYLKSL